MKKILLCGAFFAFVFAAQAQQKILWIGNSYTGVNNLPSLTNDIATSLGDGFIFDSNTPGGNTFEQHSNNPITFQKLHANDWDVVVLQAQSQEPSFPHAQVSTSTYPAGAKLNDSIQSILACAETMYYMTWGRETGDPQWDSINTFDKMNDRLEIAYTLMANENDASVAPAGVAWKYIRDHHPSIQLYTGDGSHPSYAGSYLVASVFYGMIFNKRVNDASFIGTLDSDVAATLRRAADSTVFGGDFAQWKNGAHNAAAFNDNYTGGLSFDFLNESIGDGLTYKWLFGDGDESTDENPSHTYMNTAEYDVTLITYSSCGNDTTTKTVSLSLGLDEENKIDISINKLENGYQLLFSNASVKTIELYNVNGQLLLKNTGSNEAIIRTSFKGIGILSVIDSEGNSFKQKLSF
jgi:hypothetical protein